MKKILLATTVLAMSAVAANAQAVRIGGEGRMGVLYDRTQIGGTSSAVWTQENRFQLNFSTTVQADHGLSFGAFSRVRINNGAAAVFSGSRVFVEANGLRLTFGNVDGAIRGAGVSHGYAGGCGVGYVGGHFCGDTAGLVGGVASLGLATTLFNTQGRVGTVAVSPITPAATGTIMQGQTQGFDSTGGGPASRIRLDYAIGDTRLALSHDRGTTTVPSQTEVGIRSSFDAVTVALGYSNRPTVATLATTLNPSATPASATGLAISSARVAGSVVSLSAHYNGGTWGAGLLAVRVSYNGALSPLSHTNYSLSGNVQVGGGNLYGYVGRVSHASTFSGVPVLLVPFNTAGISYGYGLGGGATLTAGIERFSGTVAGAGVSGTSASVGVAFNF
jgi:hypothetical protein